MDEVGKGKLIVFLVAALVLILPGVMMLGLVFLTTGTASASQQCSLNVGLDGGNDASYSQLEIRYATTVVGVAKSMGFGSNTTLAAKAALMTVATESGFKNLANDGLYSADRDNAVDSSQVAKVGEYSILFAHDGTGTDNDSVGLFQQRPYAGWGTWPQVQPTDSNLQSHIQRLMNPVWQAQVFFLSLKAVPDWDEMTPAEAAQAVQISRYGAYARYESVADKLLAAVSGAPAIALLPTTLGGVAPNS